MTALCPRTSAVEALHDGRIALEQAEELRLHVTSCAACTREAERLSALSALLAPLRQDETSPFRVAAGRRRLLEAAARGDSARKLRAPRVGWVLSAVAAAAVVLLAGRAAWRPRETAAVQTPAVVARELELSVTPSNGASWSRASLPDKEQLELRAGELTIAVKRHDSRRRLLLALPDGELEDVGTVFDVRVSGGRTHDVSVTEGSVALRLHGRDELHLTAGQSYHLTDGVAPAGEHGTTAAASAPPDAAIPEPHSAIPEPHSATPEPHSATAEPHSATPEPHSATPEPHSATPEPHSAAKSEVHARASTARDAEAHAGATAKGSASTHTPVDESVRCPNAPAFQDCVAAFKSGDYASAAGLFERYAAACPGGSHAEDAAYLRMVALARAGRSAEARTQAERYLERFPAGFRRKEAERLVHPE